MPTKKSAEWQYGKSPAPTNWYEAADALKSVSKPKPTHKPNAFSDRLASVEQQLKDKK